MDVTKFGERLRAVRKLRGYTQDELGRELHLAKDGIGRYERNLSSPSVDTLYLIGKKLDVSIDFLLGLKD